MSGPRILLLDIETSPNECFTWGLWNQNISINQIKKATEVICWAAKWYGSRDMLFDSVFQSGRSKMLTRVHRLMSEADAIVHFNGNRFDVPQLNREFLVARMAPPAPSKQIDILKVCRSQFHFPSNKLDYIAQALGLGKKHRAGQKLWTDCLNNDPVAWKKMERYNKHDVALLEKVYIRVLPWIKNHANHNLYGATQCCTNCGGRKLQSRGVAITQALRYNRLQCMGCGKWQRGGVKLEDSPKPEEKLYTL
jgi:hypothetical protein